MTGTWLVHAKATVSDLVRKKTKIASIASMHNTQKRKYSTMDIYDDGQVLRCSTSVLS